jgi:COMPASS component SDC1
MIQIQASSPAPHLSGNTGGSTGNSRAQTPSHTNATGAANFIAPPSVANPHGSPVRIYLNQKVTPHLLEGMKYLATHEPEKPLQWLSEFLAKKSEELEG